MILRSKMLSNFVKRQFILFYLLIEILNAWKYLQSFPRYSMFHDKRRDMIMSSVELKPREYRNLRPLPCAGVCKVSDKETRSAIFLGPNRMTIQDKGDGKCIARGVIPISIPPEMEVGLLSAAQNKDRDNVYKSWSGQTITDRNGGLFDNLLTAMQICPNTNVRKEIYEALRLKGSCESPYHGIIQSLYKYADLSVRGLLIEVADRQSEYAYVLGAAVLLVRNEAAYKWKLSANQFKCLKEVKGSTEACLVNCYMDELVGLALATNLSVVMPTPLYEGMTMDGLLEVESYNTNNLDATNSYAVNRLQVTAPYFSSIQEARLWRVEQERQQKEVESSAKRAAKIVPKAQEIKDASTFLRLKPSEKRAILRATGLQDLPRPREGPRAVDALLIPLLDEEVAYEVLRRLAETKGDMQLAAEMSDFESRKPIIAKQIIEARKRGDTELAQQLCDELNSLSTLRFDPTNPNLKGEWDVEEWYWEQRKRVYGIIAA